MSCRAYDLQINQGDDYNLSLTLTDNLGNPIDLTNSFISGYIQSKLSSSGILCNLNPEITNPPNSGMITLNIPNSNTSLIPADIWPYQIQIINTGQTPYIYTKILKGYAYIYAL